MALSEALLFRTHMGEDWKNLSPNIQARFEHSPTVDKPLEYSGVMHDVRCSFIGKILAYLTWPAKVLIPYNGKDIKSDIYVYVREDTDALYKIRTYHFPGKKPFPSKSHMVPNDAGQLVEYVGLGFGMKLTAFAKDKDLHFKSVRYFIRIGKWHIPLPHLLSPGECYVIHKDESEHTFSIKITMTHCLFGELYYQEGTFHDPQDAGGSV